MIARTLAMNAPILLLDEPTVGLDSNNVTRLQEAIVESKNKGILVLVSSHEFESVEPVLDDIVFLSQGQLEFYGSKQNFMERDIIEDIIDIIFHAPLPQTEAISNNPKLLVSDDRRAVSLRVPARSSLSDAIASLKIQAQILEATRRPHNLRTAINSANKEKNNYDSTNT